MKLTETRADRYVLGVIVYVIAPALSILFIYASFMFASLALRQEEFRLPRVSLAVGLLVIAAGLLRFSYLMFTKKGGRLSDRILYLVSAVFMILGAFVAIYPFIAPMDGASALKSFRGAGVFIIGLLALTYVRKRKKQNQASQPQRR
jgi:cytochrome bd-type quinol oxidase subunit 2